MTGIEALERINKLYKYIKTLEKFHEKESNFNIEFGEGNPDAVVLAEIIDEYESEIEGLEQRLEKVSL